MKYKRMTNARVKLMTAIRRGKSMGGEQDNVHINSPTQQKRQPWHSHVVHEKSSKPWMTHVNLMQAIRQVYLTKWQTNHAALWLNNVAQNNKSKIHIR